MPESQHGGRRKGSGRKPEVVVGEDLLGQPEVIPGPDWLYGQSPLSNHGGKRAGSGRKPQGEVAMVTTAFVIRQDQQQWLRERAIFNSISTSEFLREVIDAAMIQRSRFG